MIRGYANKGQADKSYIGAIAELLMRYPKSVALACSDPFHGVVTRTKFMPTPADIVGFCAERTEPMLEESAREDRIAEQLRARDEWLTEPPSPEMIVKTKAWLDRADPVAKALTHGAASEQAAHKQAGLETITEVGRRIFERECKAAGIDPARGVSPSLLKNLESAK